MIIRVPDNFTSERKYIVSVILKDILGLQYELHFVEDLASWEISLLDQKVYFEDHFFSSQGNDVSSWSMPQVSYFNSRYNDVPDLPVLYGEAKYVESEKSKIFSFDLFASAFFMLSRWEEFPCEHNKEMFDELGRFDGRKSVAFRNNFLIRPVVNEYIELLWHILKSIDSRLERNQKQFEVNISHDVDIPYRYPSLLKKIKQLIGDLIKRKNISLAWNMITKHIFDFSNQNDPYNNYDFFMDLSDQLKVKSVFNFISGGKHEYDYPYNLNSRNIKSLIKKITNRGHQIGFHPSFLSYNNESIWMSEIKTLRCHARDIKSGRQHFLRFEIPYTYHLWENAGMEYDSTIGYANEPGFRCGICYPFHPYDFIEKRPFRLVEIPLIVMDNTLIGYNNLNSKQVLEKITYLVDVVSRYNGVFSLLWHNHLLNDHKDVYSETISYIGKKLSH